MGSNADAVSTAHAAFNNRDFAGSAGLLSDTGTVTDHGRGVTVKGPAEFAGWMDGFVAMSSDIQIVDAKYIEADNYVTAQFRAVGIQDGPMDAFPASGKSYSLDVCEVWEFDAGGKAVEGHNYSDGLGLLMQLGHIEA